MHNRVVSNHNLLKMNCNVISYPDFIQKLKFILLLLVACMHSVCNRVSTFECPRLKLNSRFHLL